MHSVGMSIAGKCQALDTRKSTQMPRAVASARVLNGRGSILFQYPPGSAKIRHHPRLDRSVMSASDPRQT